MAEKNRRAGHGGGTGGRWSLGRLAVRRPFIIGAAVIIAGLVLFVLVWFQPQKLFLNKTVNEPGPGITGTAPAGRAKPMRAAIAGTTIAKDAMSLRMTNRTGMVENEPILVRFRTRSLNEREGALLQARITLCQSRVGDATEF